MIDLSCAANVTLTAILQTSPGLAGLQHADRQTCLAFCGRVDTGILILWRQTNAIH